MKRHVFLAIAVVIGVIFSIYMFAAPAKMMEGMGSQTNAVQILSRKHHE